MFDINKNIQQAKSEILELRDTKPDKFFTKCDTVLKKYGWRIINNELAVFQDNLLIKFYYKEHQNQTTFLFCGFKQSKGLLFSKTHIMIESSISSKAPPFLKIIAKNMLEATQ